MYTAHCDNKAWRLFVKLWANLISVRYQLSGRTNQRTGFWSCDNPRPIRCLGWMNWQRFKTRKGWALIGWEQFYLTRILVSYWSKVITWILDSHWSRVITWPGHWPLIGRGPVRQASKCQGCVNTSWKPFLMLKWASHGVSKYICQSSQTNKTVARRKSEKSKREKCMGTHQQDLFIYLDWVVQIQISILHLNYSSFWEH